MVTHICEKCGKEFTQKGHYTKDTIEKSFCMFECGIEEIIEKTVAKKIDDNDLHNAIEKTTSSEPVFHYENPVGISHATNSNNILLDPDTRMGSRRTKGFYTRIY